MEYQKIANLINDASNHSSKVKTKNWVETNDESRGTYNVNSQIKFKPTMLKSSLCDYSDKKVIFKNCAPFTNCISEINNTQIDNVNDFDIVMNMYNKFVVIL